MHVSAINRRPKGDINAKEYVILAYLSYMHSVKNI